MLLTNTENKDTNETRINNEISADNLAETTYCDYSHPAVWELSEKFIQGSADKVDFIEKIFCL
jgi:hypothetical protein